MTFKIGQGFAFIWRRSHPHSTFNIFYINFCVTIWNDLHTTSDDLECSEHWHWFHTPPILRFTSTKFEPDRSIFKFDLEHDQEQHWIHTPPMLRFTFTKFDPDSSIFKFDLEHDLEKLGNVLLLWSEGPIVTAPSKHFRIHFSCFLCNLCKLGCYAYTIHQNCHIIQLHLIISYNMVKDPCL